MKVWGFCFVLFYFVSFRFESPSVPLFVCGFEFGFGLKHCKWMNTIGKGRFEQTFQRKKKKKKKKKKFQLGQRRRQKPQGWDLSHYWRFVFLVFLVCLR